MIRIFRYKLQALTKFRIPRGPTLRHVPWKLILRTEINKGGTPHIQGTIPCCLSN